MFIVIGQVFGELINDTLVFRHIPNNTILYRDATLLCGDADASRTVQWLYSSNTESKVELPVTSANTQGGLSWIGLSTTKQGFYQCRIEKNATVSVYTVGVFDKSLTTGRLRLGTIKKCQSTD